MKKIHYFIILFIISSKICAAELLGSLEGNLYTDSAEIFTTTLPTLEGQIRDQPNAVSVYEKSTGSQDSIEYYKVPEEFLDKYHEIGPAQYHLVSQNKLIESRYKPNFESIELLKQGILKMGEHDVFVSTLSIPEGSRIKDAEEKTKDMVVLLGSLIVNSKLFIYQIANSLDQNIDDKKILALTERLKTWVIETEFKN